MLNTIFTIWQIEIIDKKQFLITILSFIKKNFILYIVLS